MKPTRVAPSPARNTPQAQIQKRVDNSAQIASHSPHRAQCSLFPGAEENHRLPVYEYPLVLMSFVSLFSLYNFNRTDAKAQSNI
jgi:hypothetical protein